MPEYIERERAKEHLIADTAYAAAKMLDEIPAADVVEVKHGEWLFNRHQAPNEKSYFCSLCAEGESNYGKDNYCPNCGAKMDLKEGVEE